MTDLPTGWAWTTLGEICEQRYGKALPADRRGDSFDIPVVGSAGVMSSTTSPLVSEPCIIVGRKGNAGAVQVFEVPTWPIDTVFYLPVPRCLDINFLAYQIAAANLGQYSSSTATPSLRREDLTSLKLAIAPLEEQRRIVAALEDHLSRVEAGVESVRRGWQRVDALIRQVLREAIPIPGPEHWRRAAVSEAGSVELGRQRHPDWHSGPNMRPYLRVANVFEGRIDTSDVMEMDFPPDVFEKFRLAEGDILLNEGQSPELLGRPAMYRGELGEVAFTNSLLRFRSNSNVDPEWALLVFRRHMRSRRYLRDMRITTNIAHLSAGRFKKVEFPIPPMSEQKKIVQQVHGQLAAVDRLAADLKKTARQANHLRQSLLREAFSGRLVEQDPRDEPASALLERIWAARANAPKVRRRRKKQVKAAEPVREIPADRPLPEQMGKGTQEAFDLGL
ncbi:restriction endonuclease subunit S [Saccharopolyspora sp. NPDC000359]|uniref:restriction endonuclease subunit S n=1 Tax=Saccharopolyspora sp. NPDC000359 TaxID=3154251 RepID=UPI0033336C08